MISDLTSTKVVFIIHAISSARVLSIWASDTKEKSTIYPESASALVQERLQALDRVHDRLVQRRPFDPRRLSCLGIVDLEQFVLPGELAALDTLGGEFVLQLREVFPDEVQDLTGKVSG